jgi:hypothetical protein
MHNGTGNELTKRNADADCRAEGPESNIKAPGSLDEVGDDKN